MKQANYLILKVQILSIFSGIGKSDNITKLNMKNNGCASVQNAELGYKNCTQ